MKASENHVAFSLIATNPHIELKLEDHDSRDYDYEAKLL